MTNRWWKEKFATLRVLLKRKSKSFSFFAPTPRLRSKNFFFSCIRSKKLLTHYFNAVDHSIFFQYTHSFHDVPEEWKKNRKPKKGVRRKSFNAAHSFESRNENVVIKCTLIFVSSIGISYATTNLLMTMMIFHNRASEREKYSMWEREWRNSVTGTWSNFFIYIFAQKTIIVYQKKISILPLYRKKNSE